MPQLISLSALFTAARISLHFAETFSRLIVVEPEESNTTSLAHFGRDVCIANQVWLGGQKSRLSSKGQTFTPWRSGRVVPESVVLFVPLFRHIATIHPITIVWTSAVRPAGKLRLGFTLFVAIYCDPFPPLTWAIDLTWRLGGLFILGFVDELAWRSYFTHCFRCWFLQGCRFHLLSLHHSPAHTRTAPYRKQNADLLTHTHEKEPRAVASS